MNRILFSETQTFANPLLMDGATLNHLGELTGSPEVLQKKTKPCDGE
jgi:hypothetical protein